MCVCVKLIVYACRNDLMDVCLSLRFKCVELEPDV